MTGPNRFTLEEQAMIDAIVGRYAIDWKAWSLRLLRRASADQPSGQVLTLVDCPKCGAEILRSRLSIVCRKLCGFRARVADNVRA